MKSEYENDSIKIDKYNWNFSNKKQSYKGNDLSKCRNRIGLRRDRLRKRGRGMEGAMDYRKAAQEVYDNIGGRSNIVSAAHCATRLRLVIADNEKCNKEAVENIDGVKGVFFASGQLQIIFGTGTVNKVYEEFVRIAGIQSASKEEVKQAASAKTSFWKRPSRRWETCSFRSFRPSLPAAC